MHHTDWRAAITAAVGLVAMPGAFAQQATDQAATAQLEEITVTAQRREENVQDIPLAVSAFSEAQMERLQITEALDIVRAVPNLTGHNNTGPGNSNAYFLRGLGNTESIATFDPPVGTYVDDVYVSRQSANNYAIFDIERIEVLRGPQGTLFGRNTTGGAVNIITRKPAEEFAAQFELGYGEFESKSVHGSVDVPINPTLLTRFSAFYEEADGFVRSTVTGEKNADAEGYGGRAALRLLPNDRLTWDLSAEYAFNSQLNPIRATNSPLTNATGFSKRDGSGSLLAQARAGLGLGSDTKTTFVISNVGLTFADDEQLNFITGYRDENWEFIIDFVPTGMLGTSGFAIANVQDTEQISQEVKLTGTIFSDRLRYTTGLFYIDEDNRTDFQDISGPSVLIDRVMENGTRSTAVYLQMDFGLTDTLTFTAGARYTDETKDIGYVSRNDRGGIFGISTAELIAGGIPTRQDFSKTTPKVALEWKPNDDFLAYVSATNGFKSGGWNARGAAPHTAASYLPFGPEEVWSYEAGFKSELLDRTLRFNFTLFQSEVEDLQLIQGTPNPSGGILFLTQNSGEARFRGAEIESQWLPLDDLTLFASIGLMDAEYTSILPPPPGPAGQVPITTDTQPVRSPDITGNAGFEYGIPVEATGGRFSVGGNVAFTGTHWTASNNTPAIAYVPRRWLYQAQIGYEAEDARWSARLSCKNCSDEEYITSFFIGTYYGDPRTWEFNVGFKFN